MPSSVTALALRAITDEQLLIDRYSTPEAVLDYLQNEKNFKELSALLKETMVNAGVCKETDPQSSFISELYRRLVEQDTACGITTKRSNAAVKNWITGKTKSIRYRNSVIELCFALKLDLEQSGNLLNKCGYNSFNVRNAEDAVYLYCILNGRPLSAAKKIMAEYYSSNSDINSYSAMEKRIDHSGSTTIILENQIMANSNWNNDESFLKSFLIPNKSKFIGFASTALYNYYMLKNYLYTTVFINDEVDEHHLVQEWFEENTEVLRTEISVSLACKSALRKYSHEISVLFEMARSSTADTDDTKFRVLLNKNADIILQLFPGLSPGMINVGTGHNDLSDVKQAIISCDNDAVIRLCDANSMLDDRMRNTREVLYYVRNGILSCKDIKSQKQFARFCLDIMKTEGFLKHVIDSITSDSLRIRKYTDSSLKESVMKEFPDDKSFANYEKDPRVIDKGMTIRKAIILMYYIAYAYEFSTSLYSEDFTYDSELFGDLGFSEFIDGLNQTLTSCRLASLYPANQFDWLILRSIREFEVSDYSDEKDNPLAFFNDVLAYSFGDNPGGDDESI